MATSSDLRRRPSRNEYADSPTDHLVNPAFSRADISKPCGRLALRSARKRFFHEVLVALQDGATDVPRVHVQAQLCFAFFVIVASMGIIFIAVRTSQEEQCVNRFGDYDRPCPHDHSEWCYQRVDVYGRVLFTRDLNGYHFEMNPNCSTEAPEDDTMKCRGEWSFSREKEVVWYMRKYLNVTSDTTSLVSLPGLKDNNLRLMAMRWIPRASDPQRSTWVFSSAAIPRDDFPEAELVIDGTVVIGQIVASIR